MVVRLDYIDGMRWKRRNGVRFGGMAGVLLLK